MGENNQNIVIESPIKGQWAILNPPGHAKTAFDFLATNDRKLPYSLRYFLLHLLASIPVTATYTWTQPVYAPLDGQVVACSNGNPDRERINMFRDLFRLAKSHPKAGSPFQAFGGNYIILKCGEVYPLLAHLKNGSLRVRTGDTVRTGQQLGEVGNSGSSIQPHLHFQIMENENPFPLFMNLLPFKLRAAGKKTGKVWEEQENVEIKKGDHPRL